LRNFLSKKKKRKAPKRISRLDFVGFDMRWSFLVARVAHWFANEVVVKKLANSEAFQRFAVRSSQSIEQLIRKGEQRLVQTRGKEGLTGLSSEIVIQRIAEKLANLKLKSQSLSEALKEEMKRTMKK
jgi:hypothetical protein